MQKHDAQPTSFVWTRKTLSLIWVQISDFPGTHTKSFSIWFEFVLVFIVFPSLPKLGSKMRDCHIFKLLNSLQFWTLMNKMSLTLKLHKYIILHIWSKHFLQCKLVKSRDTVCCSYECIVVTSIVCAASVWCSFSLCASELYYCPGTVKVQRWATLLLWATACSLYYHELTLTVVYLNSITYSLLLALVLTSTHFICSWKCNLL